MREGTIELPDLEATKVAHGALLEDYAGFSRRLAKSPDRPEALTPLQPKEGFTVFGPLRPLVRHFAASHASRQLHELRTAYVELQHARRPPVTEEWRAWLRDALAEAKDVAETLRLRRLRWDTLLALVPSSAVVWLFAFVRSVEGFSPFVFAGLFVFGVAIALSALMIQESFEAKRRLFDAATIYAHEDRLFELLGRAKRQEFPVDRFVTIAMAVGGAGFSVYFAVADGFLNDNVVGAIAWIAIAAVLLGFSARSALRAVRRVPR